MHGLQNRILLVLCNPCANCAKRKMATRKVAIIHHSNAVDYKRKCSCRCWKIEFSSG